MNKLIIYILNFDFLNLILYFNTQHIITTDILLMIFFYINNEIFNYTEINRVLCSNVLFWHIKAKLEIKKILNYQNQEQNREFQWKAS